MTLKNYPNFAGCHPAPDPFADDEPFEEPIKREFRTVGNYCVEIPTEAEAAAAAQKLKELFGPRDSLFPPVPKTLEQQQSERIATLEARIEQMERDRHNSTTCTTLLQMIASGDLAYYLGGPGQGVAEQWHRMAMEASEEMRYLAQQHREDQCTRGEGGGERP